MSPLLKLLPTSVLAASAALLAAAAPVDFNRDVRPILSDKCYACHGPDAAKRPTELRLDSEQGAAAPLAGGGRAIAPGDPQASELLARVASNDPAHRMPPAYLGHEKLTAAEIATLRRWIEQGAAWEGHWSLTPPRRPAPPLVEHESSVANAIDRFVIHRLEQEGLEPSPVAPRETLLRRVTLDLTGLPPTPAELGEFLADTSERAYERAVDRLLASPQFGEHLAFFWLEAARYADTNGYQNDQERSMWRWRDWVIRAFNDNKPFDEFTVEQLAGDLLPNATRDQILATGFNRNHRGNGELGIVDAEYAVEYVVDRVESTSTVWLGLTMGCARCHDHKYDPLSQKDFYRFYAFFNNVPDRGRYFKYGNTPPVMAAPTAEQEAELAALDARLAKLERRLQKTEAAAAVDRSRWEAALAAGEAESSWRLGGRLVWAQEEPASLDGASEVDLGDQADFDFFEPFSLAARIRPEAADGGVISRYEPAVSARGSRGYGLFVSGGKLHVRIEAADIDDRMRVESVEPVPLGRWSHVAVTYDGSRLAKGIRLFLNGEEQEVRVLLDRSNNNTTSNAPLRLGHGPEPDDRFRGEIAEARVFSRALPQEEVGLLATEQSLSELAALPSAERPAAAEEKLRRAFLAEGAPAPFRELWSDLLELRQKRIDLIAAMPTVMVMAEADPPRETFVLKRGAYDAPGEKVAPGTPGALPPLPEGAKPDRLALARWLVSPEQPLTARVTVNRFWQMLFGAGLVRTIEDFGSQGEPPTHPELLDWLAAEFIESGWDVKALLKTIVMSGTYRQSARIRPELLELDPENRLLARAPRVRLAASVVRDQALAAAGLLREEFGGPSVKPYQPAGLWKELSNWGEYEHDHGDDLYRRSLYTFWKRTIAPPAMSVFDAAPRETCVVRQTRTNTPLQALNLMNDPTYAEAARVLGERMLRDGGASDSERLEYGFRLVVARSPKPAEAERLGASLARFRDRFETSPDDAVKLLGVGERPRDESLPAPRAAAYAAVASLLLNLDETVTKP